MTLRRKVRGRVGSFQPASVLLESRLLLSGTWETSLAKAAVLAVDPLVAASPLTASAPGQASSASSVREAPLPISGQFSVSVRSGRVLDLVAPSGPLAGLELERQLSDSTAVFRLAAGSLPTPLAPGAMGPLPATRFTVGGRTLDSTLALEQVIDSLPQVGWSGEVFQSTGSADWMVPTNEVILALKPGQSVAAFFRNDARFASYRPLDGTPDHFVATLAAGAGAEALQLAERLAADPRLAWAEANSYRDFRKLAVPNDPLYNLQWHLENNGIAGGTVDADVDAEGAWDLTTGSDSIVIAVVDDGMELTHPDLAPNLFVNPGEIADNGLDDDANGYIDDTNGWDFTTNGTTGDNDPGADSTNDAHATSVAGVAAGRGNNGIGVTGISQQARILPVRIFGSTGSATTDANIASAVYYAAGRTRDGLGQWANVHIMNNSWGGGAVSSAITAAFTWAGSSARGGLGTASFIASGNNFSSSMQFPATLAATTPGVIAVGATTNFDTRSTYSNFGTGLSFVAPSNGRTYGGTADVVTTDRVGTNGYNWSNTWAGTGGLDYTDQFGGTSSATPLAAGTAGLLFARAADLGLSLTASDIKGLLRNTTDLVGPATITYDAVTGTNSEYASGRLNARRAVSGVGVAELGLFQGRTGLSGGSLHNLGSLRVGQSSTQTFRIRNEGTSPLSLSGMNLSGSGDFMLSSGLGSSELAVGQSTTFVVTFAPTGAGTRQATLSFNSNDADEATVTIDLVGEGREVSITGRVFEDWNGNATAETYDPAIAARMVYLDQNNNGSFDDTRQVLTLSSGTLNLAIPDATGASLSNSLTVAGAIGVVEDLEVTLNITHTWVSDLQIVLRGPNGASIPLITSRGGSGDNLTNTIFDDQAATAIAAGSAPFTGRFRPESPLSGFHGLNATGQWTLVVTDSVATDVGTLVNWSLRVVSSDANTFIEPHTFSDTTGVYLFENLPAGSQMVRVAPETGFITAPGLPIDRPSASTIVTGAHFPLTRSNAIYSRAYSDTNVDGVADMGESGVAGVSFFFDQNANGRFDAIQTTTTVASATLNLTIPDNSTTGVSSTLSVAGVSGPLTDLDVSLTLSHLNVGDLIVTLTSPTGTSITLMNRRGGTGDNLTNTTFDDSATISISSGIAPFTGRYRPESPLAGFNGATPNGTWTINVSDRAAGTSGLLVRWSMRVRTGELAQVTDSNGLARFDNVIAGSYTVAQSLPAGVRLTAPSGGTSAVTLNAGGSAHALHFGNEVFAASSITGRVFEDWNGNATRDAYDPGVASRQVFLDSNNNGTYDGPVTSQLDSGTISVAIPDNTTTGVSRSLVASGLTGKITDIDLTLDVTHTNIGDLVVQLTGPNNFTITLVERRGGTGDHFTTSIFDDQGTSDIADGIAPFTARYRPEVPLSNFNGLDPNGTWTITVSDRSATVTGTLVRWRLAVQTQSATTEAIGTTDTSGNYTFAALSAGTQVVRSSPTTGWNLLNTRTIELPTANTAVTGADLAQTRQNSIYTRVFNDQDGDGSPGAVETGLSSRTVFLDANGNGLLDGQQVFSSGTINLPIPDNSVTGVNSVVAVAGTTANITDLDVTVNLTHTWIGDVVLTLRSPTGTVITLINQRGSSGDNLTNTIFDDQASSAITSGTAPFTGRFRPETALSGFNGQSANGNWTLNASDRFSTDVGTILNWSMTFILGAAEPSASTDSNGLARFDNIAAGTHNVRQIQTVGWRFTSPTAGVTTATLTTGVAAFPPQFGNLADAIAPTPVSIVRTQAAITNAGTVSWTVNLSETVNGLSLANFSLTQAGVSGAALTSLTGSGSIYTVTASTGTGDGTLTLNLANGTGVVDLALNPLTGTPFAGQSYTIDRTGPQVAAFRVLYGSGRSFDVLASSRSILPWQITGIEVAFNEAIGGATLASLTGVTTTAISGVGTSTVGWNISTVTQGTLNTLLKASGLGAITDIAGNALAGGADYARMLRILFADYTGDGMVNSADLSGVYSRTTRPYDLFADIDGNGVVNSLDVGAVRRRIGARL